MIVFILRLYFWQKLRVISDNNIASKPEPTSSIKQRKETGGQNFAEYTEKVAYLQDGKIWFLDDDLSDKTEYELPEQATAIYSFKFASDGQVLYWENEAGELWKKDGNGTVTALVSKENDITEAMFEDPISKEATIYQKGSVEETLLSPNEDYFAYEALETFTGCCLGPSDLSVYRLGIVKNDGTYKFLVQKPEGERRSRLFIDGWFTDTDGQNVLFHYSFPDEATQGSPFYEVGVDGKNPKKFEGVDFHGMGDTITVAGAKPVFSPDGSKMVYIEGGLEYMMGEGDGKVWMSNSDGTDKHMLFTYGGDNILDYRWSEDGNFVLICSPDSYKIFNRQAEVIYQVSPENATEDYNSSGVISIDNKYAAILNGNKLQVVNINTREDTELEIPIPDDQLKIYPKFITKDGKMYYLLGDTTKENGYLYQQLWVIDAITGENYQIADNVNNVERLLVPSDQF